VHRDLKPANILLTADGRPKVGDFGIAKMLDDDSVQTQTGQILGTPSYMAPEQAAGRVHDVGPRTDVYALGAILYELLTGRPPFKGASPRDTLDQVLHDEPPAPSRLVPRTPRDLETVCLKALAKEPARRYADAASLGDDLRRFLDGHPIAARPVGPLGRLRRWRRRNPRLAALAAAVAALLLLAAGLSVSFAVVLALKQQETEQARNDAVAAAEEARRNAERAAAEEQRAEDNARSAAARYTLAADALNLLVNKVQSRLQNVPAAGPAREEILRDAADVLERAAADDSSALPQRGVAGAHLNLGNILWERGRKDDALRHYEKSYRILKALYEANPDGDKDSGNYAAALIKRGELALLTRNDAAAARGYYAEALRIQERNLADPSRLKELTAEEVRRSVAATCQHLGEAAFRAGKAADLAEAEDWLARAVRLQEEAAAKDPGAGRQALGNSLALRAAVALRRGDQAAADRHNDACLEVRTALAAEYPANVAYQLDLINLSEAVGDQRLLAGDAAAARRPYAEAVAANERLAGQDGRAAVRKKLGYNYYRLATALLRLHMDADADRYYGKCLRLREELAKDGPEDVNLKIDRMIALARCGRHDEAAAAARQVQAEYAREPRALVQVACCLALCAPAVVHGKKGEDVTDSDRRQQEEYAAQAVEALRQAKALGYADVKNLASEPDLDPLRERDDFRALVAGWQK